MKLIASALILFLQFLIRASARAQGDEYASDPNVIELSASNFDKAIHNTNYTTIVKFYAPWCGYCQQLKPVWRKLSKYMNQDAQLGINVAALNCDNPQNKPLCSSYQIQGFPTLMVFRPPKFAKGKPTARGKKHASEVYQGQRTLKAISSFLTSRLKNYVTKLYNLEDDLVKWISENASDANYAPKVFLVAKANSISPLLKTVAIDYLGSVDFAMFGKLNDFEKSVDIGGTTVKIPAVDKSTLFYFDKAAKELVQYAESEKLNDKKKISQWITKVSGVEPVEGPLSKKGKKLEKYRSGKRSKKNSVQHDEL
ncbi:uncharacterized protein LODBEIA_P54170 [Lodderomyces beijingensis]|uniref:Thioredoxin domain-containing protein n=1 Tax=Lodderomyces beijingensis TaxID=1775926 RepID=A0ABP0ZU55_9ASCO